MARSILNAAAVLVVLMATQTVGLADVTIRYTFETSSPMIPAAANSHPMVIYMKGNKGVTMAGDQTMIVDFATQQVTIIDTARKTYATIPAADYGSKMAAGMSAMMPGAGAPGVADMLKTMKTTCDTKNSDAAEKIQDVQAAEREITCTLTMDMPESMKSVMPSMGMKMVMRVWSASPGERVRVPGLWQLSGFELWQNYFMNPAQSLGKMLPEGVRPMVEAMQKDQSAVLRFSMEMSMNMPMPGAAAGHAKGDTPLMTMKEEMTGMSTELLDDALFSVPGGFSEEPFETVMGEITDAAMAQAKADMAKTPGPSAAGWSFSPVAVPGR